MGTFHALQTLIQRLRSQLPIAVTLTDPFTRGPIEIRRENVLADFIVDAANLGAEAQLVPALYVEFARYERAAEYSADHAAMRYTQWKSERANEYRAEIADSPAEEKPTRGKKGATAKPAKATNAEAEEYYRTHPDYAAYRDAEMQLRALQGLFAACREGMQMKARMIESQNRNVNGYLNVERNVYAAEEHGHHAQQPPASNGAYPQGPQETPSAQMTFALPAFTPPPGAVLPPMPSMPSR